VGDFAHLRNLSLAWPLLFQPVGFNSTNMRITFLTSLMVAAIGSLQNLLGLSQGTLSGNESVWLLLWGVALMALAGTLRAKLSARRSRRA
jgi:hypothetical protein